MNNIFPSQINCSVGSLDGKHRNYILLLFLFIFNGNLSDAQSTYFNVSVDFGNNWGVGSSVIYDDTAYYIAGVTGPGYKISVVQLDTTGNQGWIKHYGKTGEGWEPARAGLTRIDNSGYLLCGWIYSGDSTFGLMMRFDEAFDSIFTRRYSNMVNARMALYSGIKTFDGGYIFSGECTIEPFNADVILLKTDSLGIEQWRILYGSSNYIDRGWSIIQTPDSGFVIGGYYYQPGMDNSGNPFVVKFNQDGNFLWRKNLGGPFMDNKAMVCCSSDSSIIVLTTYSDSVYDPVNEIEYGRIHLLKYTSEGNLLWERKFCPGKLYRYVGNIKESSDGGFVSCGLNWPEVGNPYDEVNTLGWIFKVNVTGDSLWHREYHHYSSYYSYNRLYDLIQTDDGGFAACGQTTDFNVPQRFWVLKVDSLGCDTAGCDTTVGLPEEPFLSEAVEFKERLEIWPNPAWGTVWVSLKSRLSAVGSEVSEANGVPTGRDRQSIEDMTLRIYDIWGRKIMEKPWPEGTERLELDVGKLPEGIYLCVLYKGQELWLTRKLMVTHFVNSTL